MVLLRDDVHIRRGGLRGAAYCVGGEVLQIPRRKADFEHQRVENREIGHI